MTESGMLARVVFDEAHSEAWTVRPELARQMQPAHPGDASYARAAAALAERDFVVEVNADAPLGEETLAGAGVLVIAHPSDPSWERTTGSGSPRLNADELDAVEAFVARGGGLIVLGETEQDKYGNNLNELLARFGLHLENDTVQDYEHYRNAPSWVLAELGQGGRGRAGDALARVNAACLYRATTISSSNGAAVLARTHSTASVPGAPLIVVTNHGEGRVVVLADSDLFGDDCIDELDHRTLWLNLCYWAARPDGGIWPVRAERNGDGAEHEPPWLRLRDETNALALLQAPDGSLLGEADPAAARAHVAAIAAAIEELAPRFPHDAAYLTAAVEDLRAWDFGKPDFTRALGEFRPELMRADGIEHLVLFPMYKQNGSRETCFEALIVRVPWPDWIAELQRTRFDNPKFVPVELVDATRGYDSECAVLFPEMVSVAGRPVSNFGAIFCDREAARLRRLAGAASDLLRLNLPPDAACMLANPGMSQQAYILWDLIHDRAHSHGDLPFDPFMIRQRAPYWMYSLEELRCDLTAFGEAVALEAEGVSFARYVQYAILLDRLLRFPITGERIRNYDGLGGQLLFSYLHRHGYLHWTDNQLTIEWERVADGVASLRHEVEELYRQGIDRTKLQHWAAAHDLVASSVPPASGSKWVASVRDFTDVEDPRPYIDLVRDDEFPLSIFYSSLKAKLAA
ncbi:MAG: hypothetical protein JO325_18000 [Solirubrobacterales bacterium]|nr:hypothetical protein [Solirubrobacterales bacterium]